MTVGSERIAEDLSEPQRRALVADIAARGKDAFVTKEQTVAPAQNLAAAAAQAAQADPVEMSPGQVATAAAIGGGPAQDAGRFAEAQRVIFEQGRGRELAAGQEFADAGTNVARATNFQLGQYDEALAADQQARASRARSSAGSGSVDNSLADLLDLMNTGDDGAKAVADTSVSKEAIRGIYAENYEEITDQMDKLVSIGADPKTAESHMRKWLTDSGLHPEEVDIMIDTIMDKWEQTLTQNWTANRNEAKKAAAAAGKMLASGQISQGQHSQFINELINRGLLDGGSYSGSRSQDPLDSYMDSPLGQSVFPNG